MSFMTTKLRYIVEQALDNQLAAHTEDNWPLVYSTLGLDDYPIYSDGKILMSDCPERARLNNKIIRTYYMREIGLETIGLFRWYLRSAMYNIMPYYNQLYYSASLITNPLREYEETETEKMEETHTENAESTQTDTTDTTNSNTSIYSETPENMIPTGEVKNLKYATNVTFDDGTQNMDSTRRGTNDVDYGGNRLTGREKSGRRTSEMELVMKYRDAIMNIDRMIVEDDEVATCFMLVYE